MPEPLTLLTLNVSSPTPRRAEALLAYLWHRPEQVLVLTEVGVGKGSALIGDVCRAAGYDVVAPRLPGADSADRLGVLLVGRGVAVAPLDGPRPAVLPHRVNPVTVRPKDAGAGPIPLAGVYGAASDPVRYASPVQRQRKRAWLAAFQAWLPDWLAAGDGVAARAVILGDLNIVAPGHADQLRYVLAEERAAYRAIVAAGMTDAYAAAHPRADRLEAEPSWMDHSDVGCRYDHAFTRGLRVLACDLDQTPRLEGQTDHAALSLRLQW